MRENRTCGSEGGEAKSLPYPYRGKMFEGNQGNRPDFCPSYSNTM
jgi:hypothetical protein